MGKLLGDPQCFFDGLKRFLEGIAEVFCLCNIDEAVDGRFMNIFALVRFQQYNPQVREEKYWLFEEAKILVPSCEVIRYRFRPFGMGNGYFSALELQVSQVCMEIEAEENVDGKFCKKLLGKHFSCSGSSKAVWIVERCQGGFGVDNPFV